MQSSKPSKKTSKQANEAVTAAQDVNAAEATAKTRASKSSKTKKSEAVETGTVKHHHKNTPSVVEPAVAELISQNTPSVSAQSAISEVESRATPAPARQVTHAQIAELAYSYWIARGCAGGSAEADWLRAERELTESR